jgi:hypothetical protein
VDATREAEELVGLWQALQEAQVAGDVRRLEELRRLGEARAKREGASGEWALLAREAGRHTGDLREEVEERPTVGVATSGDAPVVLDEAPAPEADVEEGDEEPVEAQGRGRRLGPLIWIVIVAAYVLLQVLGEVGEGAVP